MLLWWLIGLCVLAAAFVKAAVVLAFLMLGCFIVRRGFWATGTAYFIIVLSILFGGF